MGQRKGKYRAYFELLLGSQVFGKSEQCKEEKMMFQYAQVSDALRRLVSQRTEATQQIMILLAAELNNECVTTKQGNV